MEIRDNKGKYAKKWSLEKKAAFTIVVACAVFGIGAATVEPWLDREISYKATFTPIAEAAEIVTPDTVEQMKADVLKELQLCESAGKTGKDAEELITYDPDKSGVPSRIPSFGPYQFKVGTMQHYSEKMDGKKLSNKEAIIKAMDMEAAAKVAAFVIFELEKTPSSDWYNCSVKYDLDRKAAYINKYDK